VTLLDVRSLAARSPRGFALIDVRWRLGGPAGRDGYLAGHIPRAVFLDLDQEVCGVPGVCGRHPLPEPEALQASLRAAGVRAGVPVVVYDAGDGVAAARLWWTLRWAGHDQVEVLDGGLAAWIEAGLPLEAGDVAPEPGDITVRPGSMPVLDADAAAELARTGLLLDARVEPRYRGEVEPIDPVAGHIPGAVNLPAMLLVDAGGRLRPAGEVRAAVEGAIVRSQFARAEATVAAGVGASTEELTVRAGSAPDTVARMAIGAYCGSGVTAAQTVLALFVAGYRDAALYVGSWSEWCADPSRPVARGEMA
jgi:thiosulfate/3-mercaptopyruvate sulfurtransferase